MAHPFPFDFAPPPMRWCDDALRFLLGTPVDFEHALEASRKLNSRAVGVDYRPGAGIRMSPTYTADEELDRAFEAIDEILASRRGQPAVVT